MRKRLYLLSLLLLTVCGQMWAKYSNGMPDYGTRCDGKSPTKIVEVDGVMYSLYSNQNYIYTYEYHTDSTSWSSNYAVAVYAESGDTRTELTIKSTVQDGGTTYTVVAIGEQFFYYNNTATKLTIPATVRTLETFALEDNKSNLREIVIEDSGDKLECFRTTYGYGAFSWNGGLKKVYIGRKLYPVGNSDDYAPFCKGDFTDLEVTFGPLVDDIYPYTFYGKRDNCIYSIKAMPQNPPCCGTDAFGRVSSNIPVYVSYKTRSAYSSAPGWNYFTNYVLDTELCKTDALNDLDAEVGENPSATVQGVVSDYKGQINAASSGDEVVEKLNAGKAAIQLQKAKDAAIAALNTEAGGSPSQAVANVRDTWIANVNNAGTITDVETQKNNGIAAIQLQKAKDAAIAELTEAKVANPSGAADDIFNEYKASINAATSIDMVTSAKEEGIQKLQEYVATLEAEKASAKAELDAAKSQYPSEYADDIVNNCKTEIEAATTIEDVKAAKEEGIKNLQLEYNKLQNTKNAAIAELDKAKKDYPSGNASSIVAVGKNAIENAKSQSEVIKEKEYYIAQLQTAFTAELDNAKNDAISDLNDAKDAYPSDAAEGIVSTYTGIINAATSTDAITAAKEEGVQALQDAHDAQKETERLAALDAVTVTQTANDDFSYLLEEGVAFTFAGDNVSTTVNGQDKPGFTLSETVAIKICPARTFTVIANEDPDNKGKCYSTFYTSEGAYKVPATAKAYTGEVEGDDVLKLKNVGSIIHAKEAVILRASESNLLLMPSCCTVAASPDNKLQGSDVPMTMPANSYALSYGQDGVCFYDFGGRELPANKAFLLLDAAAHSNGLRFVFDDATDIDTPVIDAPANAYNLQGQQVDETYQGIVIINGKKVLKR